MWQKARIIDRDFLPAENIGRELWVKDRPFVATFQELLRTEGGVLPEEDRRVPAIEGEWMLSNLGFPTGKQCRVWKNSIELLPEFKEQVTLIDVNTGVIIREELM